VGTAAGDANYGTALGYNAEVDADDATALGANTLASYENSTAIGYGAETLFANQFMFGTASNTYTMPGIVSDASRAAQTGDLEFVMTDAYGNLASDGGLFRESLAQLEDLRARLADAENVLSTPVTLDPIKLTEPPESNGLSTVKGDTADGTSPISAAVSTDPNVVESLAGGINANVAAINSNATAISTVSATASRNQERIANNSSAIATLNTGFETLGLQVDELAYMVSDNTEQIAANTAGIAIANAMAGTSWLQANETHAFTANWGHYDNTNAFALSATQRLNEKWSANMAIGVSPDEGKVGARAGVRLGW
jgi:hypothetical protein